MKSNPVYINLGCGSSPKNGWINVDIVKQDGVDVVHDLDVFPWPWDDGTVAKIHGIDVYEHVSHPLEFMAECWRILKPGGELYLHTAHWQNKASFNDPTHKRFLTESSFDYWIPGTKLYALYGPAYNRGTAFQRIGIHLDGPAGDLNVRLKKMMLSSEHPDTLAARDNAARMLARLGRLEEAEAEHRDVLEICTRTLGADHPGTLATRNNLARVLARPARLEEAEAEHPDVPPVLKPEDAQARRLAVFADYHQFFLTDHAAHADGMRSQAADPELASTHWTEKAVHDHRILIEPNALAVGTARRDIVEVLLRLHASEPAADLDAPEHVAEGDLGLPSGDLAVCGSADDPGKAPHFLVAPASYRVRVSFHRCDPPPQNTSQFESGDHYIYQVDLWPAPGPAALAVLKQGQGRWAG